MQTLEKERRPRQASKQAKKKYTLILTFLVIKFRQPGIIYSGWLYKQQQQQQHQAKTNISLSHSLALSSLNFSRFQP